MMVHRAVAGVLLIIAGCGILLSYVLERLQVIDIVQYFVIIMGCMIVLGIAGVAMIAASKKDRVDIAAGMFLILAGILAVACYEPQLVRFMSILYEYSLVQPLPVYIGYISLGSNACMVVAGVMILVKPSTSLKSRVAGLSLFVYGAVVAITFIVQVALDVASWPPSRAGPIMFTIENVVNVTSTCVILAGILLVLDRASPLHQQP